MRVLVLAVVVGGVSRQPRADHWVAPCLISELRLGVHCPALGTLS